MLRVHCVSLPLALAALLVPGTARAQAADATAATGHVSLELNSAETVENGCRLTFLAQNLHGVPIDGAVYETVLFTHDGNVDRLTLFDFGALPVGRPRVRQFDVPGVGCAGIGRILINGSSRCAVEGLPEGACETGLTVTSRVAMELLG